MYPAVPAYPRTSVPILFQPAVVAVTASPYDGPLSELREHVEDLGAWLVIWCNRSEPDAQARRRASDAIDAMLRDLHTVRQQLIGEIREVDDATAARADALLARGREGGEHT